MQQLSSGFSKTITLDFNWGEFVNMLNYKAGWQGKHLVKVNRWFASSKICNHCGTKKEDLRLSDREWVCKECGSINDRDMNASKNIKEEGLKILNMAGTAKIDALRDMLPNMESAGEATSFRL
jgi:putative transposase